MEIRNLQKMLESEEEVTKELDNPQDEYSRIRETIYKRDAEIRANTIKEVCEFLNGKQFARNRGFLLTYGDAADEIEKHFGVNE